jgi:pumilio RNA-binding family
MSPSSPDFSPASVTSSLLTPTDLSPSRPGFDPKLHSPYELGQGVPYLPQSSLLFDHTSPMSPSYRPQYPPSATAFPFFEPFSEPPTPAPPPQSHQHYNTPPVRRMDSGRPLPPMDWRLAPQQQLQPPSPSDWLLPDDKLEYNSGAVGLDEPLRSSFVYQHPSIPQGPSHEVDFPLVSTRTDTDYMRSRSTFCRCCTHHRRHLITSSWPVSSSHRINKQASSFNKSSRSPI